MSSIYTRISFLFVFTLLFSLPAWCAKTVSGTLLQVTGKGPAYTLIVLSQSKTNKYILTSSTIITRGQVGEPTVSVKASDLSPGDQLTIELDSKGNPRTLTARYQVIRGQVKTPSKKTLLLADGHLIDLNPSLKVTTEEGTAVAYSVLRSGDYVTLKLNPVTKEAWRIILSDKVMPVTITAINHNAERPLAPGDKLTVTIEGTPGGKAVFSVSDVVSDVKMTETRQGYYTGSFTITADTPPARSAAVTAKLSKDGKSVGPVQAGRLVSISIPVPTPKPEAQTLTPAPKPKVQPQARQKDEVTILRPAQGTKVHNPLIVVGKAKPGSKLRTTVTYSNGMTGLLKLEGTLYREELKAGSDGRFQSNPISLPQAYAGKDLQVTVKVEPLGESSTLKPVIVRVRTE